MKIGVKEKTKIRVRKYYLKNRDSLLMKSNLYNKTHPRKWDSVKKNYQRYASSPKGIYTILKKNIKGKNRFVEFSQEEFMDWYLSVPKRCYYCGITEDKVSIIGAKRLEIDRKDNNGNYSIGNIVLACPWCNGVKGNILTENEMKIVSQAVIKPKWRVEVSRCELV